MSRKQWYIVASAKGLSIYRNCKTKRDAEQLLKNLKRIINNNSIIFWLDFNWKNDLASEKQKHGKNFLETNNIIKECGEYLINCL